MTYLSTGYNRADLLAVKLGGSGDITNTHIVWRYTRNVPQKPSPLLVGDTLFMVSDSGVATCLDAKTGAEIWKERIGGGYSASPLYADGRIYCFSEDGRSVVLQPGRTYQVLAENQLAAGFMASPAVAGKALFLRTKTHVYRIEK
jgi:outer membrane protein assembly factor BamB